jgi:hypothetical protein
MIINFVERQLSIEGVQHQLTFPIDDAFEYNGMVIVLFDPDSPAEDFRPFHNLIAVDPSGQQKWEAELPTSSPGDRYYRISSKNPLTVYSAQSYDCVIDPSTGRIVTKTFTK